MVDIVDINPGEGSLHEAVRYCHEAAQYARHATAKANAIAHMNALPRPYVGIDNSGEPFGGLRG